MFDLNLAHIQRTERERDLVAELRAREILKASVVSTATEPAASRPAQSTRVATRARALGR